MPCTITCKLIPTSCLAQLCITNPGLLCSSQCKLPANKFWSGLLKSYYLPRASKYFTYLTRSLQENRSFQLEEWRKDWISYSNKWQSGKELYAVKSTGDALAISRSLYRKYFS